MRGLRGSSWRARATTTRGTARRASGDAIRVSAEGRPRGRPYPQVRGSREEAQREHEPSTRRPCDGSRDDSPVLPTPVGQTPWRCRSSAADRAGARCMVPDGHPARQLGDEAIQDEPCICIASCDNEDTARQAAILQAAGRILAADPRRRCRLSAQVPASRGPPSTATSRRGRRCSRRWTWSRTRAHESASWPPRSSSSSETASPACRWTTSRTGRASREPASIASTPASPPCSPPCSRPSRRSPRSPRRCTACTTGRRVRSCRRCSASWTACSRRGSVSCAR